jgi:hypothetical protein
MDSINYWSIEMHFETHIPIPPARPGKYPFPKLQPGESVLYPCTDSADRHKARKAAYRIAEYNGWKITARSMPEGIRVWRIT